MLNQEHLAVDLPCLEWIAVLDLLSKCIKTTDMTVEEIQLCRRFSAQVADQNRDDMFRIQQSKRN